MQVMTLRQWHSNVRKSEINTKVPLPLTQLCKAGLKFKVNAVYNNNNSCFNFWTFTTASQFDSTRQRHTLSVFVCVCWLGGSKINTKVPLPPSGL